MIRTALHNRFLVFFALCFCGSPLLSQPASKYVGKVLTQRTFYYGSLLPYDEDGKLLKPASACSWTLCAKIRITDVHFEGTLLKVAGERLFFAPLPHSDDFVDIFTEPKWHFLNDRSERELRKMRQVEIDVQRATPWDEAAIDAAMLHIFLPDDTDLTEHVPLFWKEYFCKKTSSNPDSCGGEILNNPPAKVGGRIAPPRVINQPDPNYTKVAQLAGFQGTTILWIVVTPDGRPSNIKITRAIGLGLDDMAVGTVMDWRFRPATIDGKPVAVQINIEVNFRLN